MNRILHLLVVSFVSAGLLTGCPKKEEPKEEPKEEMKDKKEEPKEEMKKEEPKEAPASKVEAKVDEALYLKAAFEVGCVKAKIEDAEKQVEILKEVYARYGMDEAKFKAAEMSMKDATSTNAAVKTRMEKCTPEIAAALQTKGSEELLAGAESAPAKVEVKKIVGKTFDGTYSAANVSGGGLEGASLKINVKKGNQVLATFKGKREGKQFLMSLRGKVANDGSISANGTSGPNNARITGKISGDKAAGSIQGSINKKGFKATFNAKK